MEIPEELFERIRFFKNKSVETSKQEAYLFSKLISKRIYPNKCLSCIQNGFRWCIHWLSNFKCNIETNDESYKKLKRLGL